MQKWREDCFYIFFQRAINQTADRALLRKTPRFIEPRGSIGGALPEKTGIWTMAIRHRCFTRGELRKRAFEFSRNLKIRSAFFEELYSAMGF
jgi:hypothetical protein